MLLRSLWGSDLYKFENKYYYVRCFYDISFGNILLFSWWPWDPMGYRPLYVYVDLHTMLYLDYCMVEYYIVVKLCIYFHVYLVHLICYLVW